VQAKDFTKNNDLIKDFLNNNKNVCFLELEHIDIIKQYCKGLTAAKTMLVCNYFMCGNNKTKAILNTYNCSYDTANGRISRYFSKQINDIINNIIFDISKAKLTKDAEFVADTKEYLKNQIYILSKIEDNAGFLKMLNYYVALSNLSVAKNSDLKIATDIMIKKIQSN
jgi:hypothetical protein